MPFILYYLLLLFFPSDFQQSDFVSVAFPHYTLTSRRVTPSSDLISYRSALVLPISSSVSRFAYAQRNLGKERSKQLFNRSSNTAALQTLVIAIQTCSQITQRNIKLRMISSSNPVAESVAPNNGFAASLFHLNNLTLLGSFGSRDTDNLIPRTAEVTVLNGTIMGTGAKTSWLVAYPNKSILLLQRKHKPPPRRRQHNAVAPVPSTTNNEDPLPMEGVEGPTLQEHPPLEVPVSVQTWVDPATIRLQTSAEIRWSGHQQVLEESEDEDEGYGRVLPGELQSYIADDDTMHVATLQDVDGFNSESDSSEDHDLDAGDVDEEWLDEANEDQPDQHLEIRMNVDVDSEGEMDALGDAMAAALADIAVRESFEREAARALKLDSYDLNLARIYTLKVESHLTESTYAKLFKVFPNSGQLPLKRAKKHIESLAGFAPVRYDCCVDSCVCFSGPYANLRNCPICGKDRFKPNGHPRKYFDYLPLIPRLKAKLRNRQVSEEMLYRSQHVHEPGKVKDVYDGSLYRSLLSKVVPDSSPPNNFFSDDRDIALGLSTDGFSPFDRRDKTCWPILLFNYNLPPETRFKKENCINVGTIPGPLKPKDWDSFCFALFEELVRLEIGVEAYDGLREELFLLRAFLILVFGDIPAVALMMRMKGQNGLRPCRSCNILAVADGTPGKHTHYVPLSRRNLKDANKRPLVPASYDPEHLPMRNHDEFMAQAKEVQLALTQDASSTLSKHYGIKGIPRLSSLSSLSFPSSFPYDFMHLIWENTVKNLILLWTGSFKTPGVTHANEDYLIPPHVWETIGAETLAAGKTIPAAFGAAVPNIAKQGVILTAEMYSNWTLFIAPIVLRGRFRKPVYYTHFLEFVRLLKLCLAIDITTTDVNNIEVGFRKWVTDYEKLYYMFKPQRLPCCPLTIHALLHIANGIRMCGPVWTYWAYPMERHCNILLPAIRSRRYPYTSIAKFVTAISQLDEIRLVYDAKEDLNLDPPKAERGLIINHPDYLNYRLTPPMGPSRLDDDPHSNSSGVNIRAKIQVHLATRYKTTLGNIRQHFPINDDVLQFGRIVLIDTGEVIRAWDFFSAQEDSRDNTFIRYDLDVDNNTRNPEDSEDMYTESFYGQLLRVIVLDLPAAPPLTAQPTTLALALVRETPVTIQQTIPVYQNPGGTEVIDLSTIQCVVGRVLQNRQWSYVDRTVCVGSAW
ncbi:hypothetical protein CVT24_000949 [Panaeolus cyanescens]|uniref:Transposase family Tnp2 protein n=1 Tax=Panaeolus cyanescens TaxID=181874 RepID=A0A409YCJ7_9AGAR|nr:hypothetical protein CVT24_000949 [Panaeolus cyanescens]